MNLKLPFATLVSLSLASSIASAHSPYGEDDTLGALNLLTKRNAKKAAKLVKKGNVYSLALETGPTTPAYPGRSYSIAVGATPDPFGSNAITFVDDQVMMHNGIGTQIDGFGHAGINSVHYNNTPVEDFVSVDGLTKFSTSDLPPVVTRGILLNMADYFGMSIVPFGTVYNQAEIEGALKKQKLKIKEGDVVLFYSGWNQLLGVDDVTWLSVHPGLGKEGAQFLADKGVVAIGADTAALEVIPFEEPTEVFPVHQILLAQNGVYILEGLHTDELAKDGVDEFMFVLGVPKLAGSVQAVINPIAIR